MPRKWRGKEARKIDIAIGGWVKRDLEKVGEGWRTRATDRKNWRLLIENVVREK